MEIVQRKGGFIYHEAEPEPCCVHCFDEAELFWVILQSA
jgi:hypothetical protein